jgi:sugar phosphate permease
VRARRARHRRGRPVRQPWPVLGAARRRGSRGYGWVLVGTLAVTETVSFGVLGYAFGVFLLPMQAELGWSRASVTGAYSLAVVVSGLAAVPVGRWLDRHGARLLMTVGSSAATVLVVAWSQVHSLAWFYGIWAGIGLAMAAVLYEPAFAVVAVWFPAAQRTRALLTLTVVAGFSSVVFTPLTDWLIETQGWRQALVTLAVLLGALTIAPHALLLRHPREPDPGAEQHPATAEASVPVRAALADRAFWWLTAALFLATLAVTAVSVHLVAYLREAGHSARFAATWAGLLGLASVSGRLLATTAGRRQPLALVVAAVFALQGVAVIVLLAWRHPAGVVAFVGLFGLGFGLVSLARAALVADFYGAAHYATLGGVVALLLTTARALAPVGAGALRTWTGSYQPVMATVLAASLLAATAMIAAHAARS